MTNGIRITAEDVNQMDRAALVDAKLEIDSQLGRITEQIREAKLQLATTGEYSDPDWYRRATAAKRIMGTLSQRIQQRLGELRRAQATENRAKHAGSVRAGHLQFLHAFYRLAKKELPPGQFGRLQIAAGVEKEALGSECSICAETGDL